LQNDAFSLRDPIKMNSFSGAHFVNICIPMLSFNKPILMNIQQAARLAIYIKVSFKFILLT